MCIAQLQKSFIMFEKRTKKIEENLILIGGEISSWRHHVDMRHVVDQKSFKTNADLKAHRLLVNLITSHFPGAIVLSEEDTHYLSQRPEKYWLIDPIDGTASWFDGFDGFVTQIAYIDNNIPVYGAVYAPVLNKLWTAHKGSGAYLNNNPLPRLVETDRLNLIDNYSSPKQIAKKVSDLMSITNYIECGSLGLKACMVADGTADLFIKDVVIRDWDIAPSSVVIGELGGIMWDLKGNGISFTDSFEKNHGLLVARDPNLAQQVLRTVKECYHD